MDAIEKGDTQETAPLTEELRGMRSMDGSASIARLIRELQNGPDQQSAAAWLFRHAYYQTHRQAIVECGGIGLLFHTLETASDYYLQLYALGILASIESDRCEPLDKDPITANDAETNKRLEALEMLVCLYRARPDAPGFVDIVPHLVVLLQRPNTSLSATAARAVMHLGQTHATRLANEGVIPVLLTLLQSGDAQQKDRAAMALGVLVSGDSTIQAQAVSAGAIETLVQLLRDGGSDQNRSAALALVHLVDQNAERQAAAVDAGAIEPLLALLGEDSDETTEATLYAIMTLPASDHETSVRAAVAVGLNRLLQSRTYQRKCRGAFMVGHFITDNRPRQSAFGNDGGVVTPLVHLVRDGSDHETDAAAQAIAQLVQHHSGNKTRVVEAGVLELLVHDLTGTKCLVSSPAMTTLGEDIVCEQFVYRPGAFTALVAILGAADSDEAGETQTAITLIQRLSQRNTLLAVEMALAEVLKLLVERLQASVDRSDSESVVASLFALSFLSQRACFENALVGLGIRNVLVEAAPLGDTTRTLATRVAQHLGLSAVEPDAASCRIM